MSGSSFVETLRRRRGEGVGIRDEGGMGVREDGLRTGWVERVVI